MTDPRPVAVAHCRAGFEAEAAADLARIAKHAGARIAPRIEPASARVVAALDNLDPSRWSRALRSALPVFVRALFTGTGPWRIAVPGPPRPDRVAPLAAAFAALADDPAHAQPWLAPWVEYADTNDGKALSPLARALEPRLGSALADLARARAEAGAGQEARLRAASRPHAFLEGGEIAYVGTSDDAAGNRWPLGIPRIRVPGGMPSRSAHKLAEAIAVFLDERADVLLREGGSAVDLGAAPGGWTALLVARGMHVTAVDNGALDAKLARHPNVEHLRADGLAWRPKRPVDWLVCDIVERPARIAALVADWIATGAAARAIVNLKLPMKRRAEEVAQCDALMRERLAAAGVDATITIRHLYHDREEVTAFVERREPRDADRDGQRAPGSSARPYSSGRTPSRR